MKTITLEEFKTFNPCWLETEEGREKLEGIGKRKERWTALDILELEEASAEDKLWAVLRPELVEDAILHEFAFWCAEGALKLVKNPDPRSVAAIEAKRRWLRGEIGDEELEAARSAARAAAWAAAQAAAWAASAASAARAVAQAAARDAARSTARSAAWSVAWSAADAAWAAAQDAAWDAWDVTWDAAWDAARRSQVEMLKAVLREWEEGNRE